MPRRWPVECSTGTWACSFAEPALNLTPWQILRPQIVSIVTAGSTNGTGLFYPSGLYGAINGSAASQSLLAGRRRMLAAPEEQPPLVAAKSSRKLQQATGVRSSPLLISRFREKGPFWLGHSADRSLYDAPWNDCIMVISQLVVMPHSLHAAGSRCDQPSICST